MTWLLLALSLLLLQFHRTLSLATLLAATISALFTGVMDWHALLTLWFAILLAVARPYTAPRSWQRVLLTLLVITVVRVWLFTCCRIPQPALDAAGGCRAAQSALFFLV